MRLLLTTILLTLLAQPAFAKTVYYCETFGFAQVTDDGEVLDIRPYRFKMAVSRNRVEIRSKDFGDWYLLEPEFAADNKRFRVVQDSLHGGYVAARFKPPELRLVFLNDPLAAVIAQCDDF